MVLQGISQAARTLFALGAPLPRLLAHHSLLHGHVLPPTMQRQASSEARTVRRSHVKQVFHFNNEVGSPQTSKRNRGRGSRLVTALVYRFCGFTVRCNGSIRTAVDVQHSVASAAASNPLYF